MHYSWTCVQVCTQCTHTHTHIKTHRQTYTHTHTHTVDRDVHMYAHTHTHTSTHTHTEEDEINVPMALSVFRDGYTQRHLLHACMHTHWHRHTKTVPRQHFLCCIFVAETQIQRHQKFQEKVCVRQRFSLQDLQLHDTETQQMLNEITLQKTPH